MATEAVAGRSLASLERLTYHYPGSARPALDDVQLTLEPGLTVVAGGSASGKSSLLRVLNGLVPHFHGGRVSGAATVLGHDVLRTPTHRLAREVGFVFQDPESQLLFSTVEREVAFGMENLGLPARQIAGRLDQALAAAGIEDLRGRRLDQLSGGERQRVALASALAMRPAILALDEPTSQLDPDGARGFLDACLQLGGDGDTSVVLAEHRLDRVLAAADALLVMESGAAVGPDWPGRLLRRLPHPPQLVELGLRLGWDPPPLTLEDARAMAPPLAQRPGRQPAAVGGQVAWETRGLTVAAGRGAPAALEAIDLAGMAGEVVVLVGGNGCGKSTLLRAIAGLARPLAGRVERVPGRVAYLPQDPTALLHRPTVRAEVALTLSYDRVHAGDTNAEVDRVLAELRVLPLAGRYPRDLSGGERQRVAIAAIVAGSPALALLDEPTRGMDGAARLSLATVVHRLRDQGGAVVLATHDAELAAEVGDRVVRLEAGRAVDLGRPETALSGSAPLATPIGRLYPGGPVTVDGLLRCI